MRSSPLSAIAVVALLALAGCVGVPSAGGNGPSPDEFPNASDIDPSVFETHAAELSNTSFTLSSENNRTNRNPPSAERDFLHMNDTSRNLVDPGASRYLVHFNGFSGNGTIYSNGSTEYVLLEDNNRTRMNDLGPRSVFNESGKDYLWRGWFTNDSESQLAFSAIDATYEREGVETFQGGSVMRYEATGVDALPDWAGGENASSSVENFSATLLLDEDGIIRHYEYEFVWEGHHPRRIRRAKSLSDIGSTDVQKPDWAANAVSNTTPEA